MKALLFKWKWVLTALLCFLLLYIIPDYLFEAYYARGVFQYIRKFLDQTFGKLPFPSIYLFFAFLLIIILKWILHFFRERPRPLVQHLFRIVSFSGFLITVFFLIWGFNYGRISLEKQLRFDVRELTTAELINELDVTVLNLTSIRQSIQKDTLPVPQIAFINNIETRCRRSLNAALSGFQYDTSAVRGRIVMEDLFMVFNVGGLYMPFVGEGNIDEAVYFSKKPFYMIHEMAHGNGFTSESDCNFIAYVSCMESGNLSLQYSAEINYLLYLMEELRNLDPAALEKSLQNMSDGLVFDLKYMEAHYKYHSFRTGFLGELVNNFYLKSLKVKEGTKSYDRMVLLVYAWKHKNYRLNE
jgi:hypothetical protein